MLPYAYIYKILTNLSIHGCTNRLGDTKLLPQRIVSTEKSLNRLTHNAITSPFYIRRCMAKKCALQCLVSDEYLHTICSSIMQHNPILTKKGLAKSAFGKHKENHVAFFFLVSGFEDSEVSFLRRFYLDLGEKMSCTW